MQATIDITFAVFSDGGRQPTSFKPQAVSLCLCALPKGLA